MMILNNLYFSFFVLHYSQDVNWHSGNQPPYLQHSSQTLSKMAASQPRSPKIPLGWWISDIFTASKGFLFIFHLSSPLEVKRKVRSAVAQLVER